MPTTQTVHIQTYDYGASLSSATLRVVSTDVLVATADTVNEVTADSGLYAAVFGETAAIAAGEYRLRAIVSGKPINRYVTLAGTDGEIVEARNERLAVLDSASRLAIWNTLTTEAFTADSFGDLLLISDGTNGREVKVTGANHIAADVHDVQPDGLSGSTEVAAINTFATRVTTGLVAHGAVYQFTANMLELGPSGTGGDATLAKQTEILAAVAGVTSSVASHAARLALEVQIQGFPAVICRNSDYVTETESEIRLTLQDLTGTAITEIAGTPVASLAWLFGMGTEAAPAIIAGAVTWDAGTSELVIQFARSVTAVKPLGSITWQIGVSTGSGATLKNRWLGGGTTRLIERQF